MPTGALCPRIPNGQGNLDDGAISRNAFASGSCGLTDNSVAGDWRLPSGFEFESLLHLGVFGLAIPNTDGTGSGRRGIPSLAYSRRVYWSGTSSPPAPAPPGACSWTTAT